MSTKRVFGLDILRAIAILTVVYGHLFYVLPTGLNPFSTTVRLQFFDGVSLFFVLSGYLIGGILLKKLTTEAPTFPNLFRFWRDRWLRTLPAYFVVLALIVLAPFRDFPLNTLKPYPFFLQNLWDGEMRVFGESWSLSVEEWFYLLIPMMLFGMCYLKGARQGKFLMVILMVIFSSNMFRIIKVQLFQPQSFDRLINGYMMTVPSRMDAIMFGVLAAWVAFFHPQSWVRYAKLSFVIGLTGTLFNHFYFNGTSAIGFYHQYLSLPVQGFSAMLLLPYMSTIKTGTGFVAKVISFISRISYATYLLHGTVFLMYSKALMPDSFPVQLACYLFYAFGLAWVMHATVEKWGLTYRDKIKQRERNTLQPFSSEPEVGQLKAAEVLQETNTQTWQG